VEPSRSSVNKADLASDLVGAVAATTAAATGVPVLTTTALDADGAVALQPYLTLGRTIALLGLPAWASRPWSTLSYPVCSHELGNVGHELTSRTPYMPQGARG
jgi:hypothetical protein